MDFSIPTLFVIPPANILPSGGSTSNLTDTRFGIYSNKYEPLTAADSGTVPYFYFVQNRKVQLPGLGTKKSEKIYKQKVLEWYKVPSVETFQTQQTTISNFNAKCDNTLILTLRLFSNYIENAFANGLTKSYTITTPCCCPDGTCPPVTQETILNLFAQQIMADPVVSKFIAPSHVNSNDAAILYLEGKPLDKLGNPCLPTAFPYEYDKLRFDAWVTYPIPTTQDYLPPEHCNPAAKVTVTRKSTYPTGSGDEIYQLEKRYHSYQSTHKSIFENPAFNGAFERESLPNKFYTTYYLKFLDPADQSFELAEKLTQSIIVAIPAGEEGDFETVVNPALGIPEEKRAWQ